MVSKWFIETQKNFDDVRHIKRVRNKQHRKTVVLKAHVIENNNARCKGYQHLYQFERSTIEKFFHNP